MNKLEAIIHKHKAARHGIPPGQGWLTRAQVARQLGVKERNVPDLLRDALEAKDLEMQKFSDWDALAMRPVTVVCYRVVEAGAAPKGTSRKENSKGAKVPARVREAILRAHARHPEMSAGRLCDYLPKSMRSRIDRATVEEVLARS